GHYSVDLPAAASYQLHVEAVDMPGYTPKDVTVDVGSASAHRDIALTADPATCTAPGYAYSYDGGTTDFDGWTGTTPQDGWTITDNIDSGDTWRFDDPAGRGNLTGGSGGFAIVDSGYVGRANEIDTSLVSPVTDLSDTTTPEIGFDTDYNELLGAADVDLSVDGGATWTNVWEKTWHAVNGHVDIPIPAAAGESQVQVRFRYHTSEGWWWELDNVFLGNRSCDPTAGGLVAGVVRDDNTDAGLVGAKVASDAHPGQLHEAAATPDDPSLLDGFYWLFSPHLGSTAFTVSHSTYAPTSGTVDVPANFVRHQDWRLAAGHLTIDRGSISVSERMGRSTTRPVTFTNDGTEPVHVKLREQDAGFTAMGGPHRAKAPGAPTKLVKGSFPVGSMMTQPSAKGAKATPDTVQLKNRAMQLRQPTPSSGAWADIADYPVKIMDNAVASYNGKVYSVGGFSDFSVIATSYVYDPSTLQWSRIADAPFEASGAKAAFVDGIMYVVGGWVENGPSSAHVYAYDPAADSWTQVSDLPLGVAQAGLATVDGDIYAVGGCTTNTCTMSARMVQRYDPDTDTWAKVARYPTRVSYPACAEARGRLVCAGGLDSNSQTYLSATYIYDPEEDSWTQGADMPVAMWGAASSGADGKLQVATGVLAGYALSNQAFEYDPQTDTWADLPNTNNAVFRGGSACGMYQVGGGTPSGMIVVAHPWVQQLPGYGQCHVGDLSWLSEDAAGFDVAPGESVTVRVTVDSSAVAQPGDYQGRLSVRTDAPYWVDPISVAMHVQPPRSWGKISGTVTEAGTG
ncbi:MAG: kelch repeat-containing protein, partial [Nocardioidaceae bacterium]